MTAHAPPSAPPAGPPAFPSAGPPAVDPRRVRLLHPDPAVRRLGWMTLVNSFGNGLSMTVSVLFFTRGLHLDASRVGLGLTLAGLCGVLASVPAGRAADRWGSKRVLMALVVVEAVGTASYALVHGFVAFLLLACAVTAVDRGSSAVRNTLYAQAMTKDARVEGRAYLRTVTNVAMGAGAALAAIALQADTRQAYLTAILVDAATFAAVAFILPSIPLVPSATSVQAVEPVEAVGPVPSAPSAPSVRAVPLVPAADDPPPADAAGKAGPGSAGAVPTAPARPRGALGDLPFVVVTLLNSVLAIQFALIEVGIPLWLVQSTRAPRVMVAPLLITNTVLVVLLQMRAARVAREPRTATRVFRAGSLLIAAFCVVAALAHGLSPVTASLVLVAASVLQSLGEVLTQAAGWTLSYELAREDSMGAYQGVFNAGQAAAQMLGPALVTVTALSHGLAGWTLLAALFALSGLAIAPAVRWARQRQPVAPAL